MAKWTKQHDGRSDQEIKDATTTLARTAQQLDHPMSTPGERHVREIINQGIDMNLDELERRR